MMMDMGSTQFIYNQAKKNVANPIETLLPKLPDGVGDGDGNVKLHCPISPYWKKLSPAELALVRLKTNGKLTSAQTPTAPVPGLV